MDPLLVDPNQVQSSSEFRDILSPVAPQRLQSSWQFLFRSTNLGLDGTNWWGRKKWPRMLGHLEF
jgi:hypothetical protein